MGIFLCRKRKLCLFLTISTLHRNNCLYAYYHIGITGETESAIMVHDSTKRACHVFAHRESSRVYILIVRNPSNKKTFKRFHPYNEKELTPFLQGTHRSSPHICAFSETLTQYSPISVSSFPVTIV